MHICVLTLFPDTFEAINVSIVKRAQEKKTLTLEYINIRDFASDAYKTVDDRPYGGGKGMILRVDVLGKAIEHAKKRMADKKYRVILLDPQGTPYVQKTARQYSKLDGIILVCGHYEGVDERIRNLVDEELSIGDYVLTGGELPAMVVIDSITRLLPGTLSTQEATTNESFEPQKIKDQEIPLLETPQYTRPPNYNGQKVPDILLSGNHAKIESWRKEQAHLKTKKLRKDLLRKISHS